MTLPTSFLLLLCFLPQLLDAGHSDYIIAHTYDLDNSKSSLRRFDNDSIVHLSVDGKVLKREVVGIQVFRMDPVALMNTKSDCFYYYQMDDLALHRRNCSTLVEHVVVVPVGVELVHMGFVGDRLFGITMVDHCDVVEIDLKSGHMRHVTSFPDQCAVTIGSNVVVPGEKSGVDTDYYVISCDRFEDNKTVHQYVIVDLTKEKVVNYATVPDTPDSLTSLPYSSSRGLVVYGILKDELVEMQLDSAKAKVTSITKASYGISNLNAGAMTTGGFYYTVTDFEKQYFVAVDLEKKVSKPVLVEDTFMGLFYVSVP